MSLNAEGASSIIVALAGLMSGMYNLMQARRVKALDERDTAERERDEAMQDQHEAERLLEIAMRYIHTLRLDRARHGLDDIPLPKALE